VLDRLRRGDRDLERARIGVADVLGGEDDHPPHDEARVLAALEHDREVVERRIGIGAARGLDPGRDRVVVAVAGLVVGQRASLQRVLGGLERHPPMGVGGEVEGGERGARIAAGARGEEGDRVVVGLGAERLHGAAQDDLDVAGQKRAQLVDLAARQQRRVDLEVRVLGRRPDERHEPLLDRRQQRVLLGLVEAVDLVEEEDGRLGQLAAVLGALEDLAHLRAPGLDRAELLQGGMGRGGHDPRQRRLARARRPVEDHRVRAALLDGRAQGRALREQVLLPDELVERAWPQPGRQRSCQGIGGRAPRLHLVGIEERAHAPYPRACAGGAPRRVA
jgi:hypothetical protein